MSSDSPSKSLASCDAGGSGGWEGCVGVPAPPRAKSPPPQRGSGPDPSRRGGDLAGGQAGSAPPGRATERRGRTQGGIPNSSVGNGRGAPSLAASPGRPCLGPLPGKDWRRSPALLLGGKAAQRAATGDTAAESSRAALSEAGRRLEQALARAGGEGREGPAGGGGCFSRRTFWPWRGPAPPRPLFQGSLPPKPVFKIPFWTLDVKEQQNGCTDRAFSARRNADAVAPRRLLNSRGRWRWLLAKVPEMPQQILGQSSRPDLRFPKGSADKPRLSSLPEKDGGEGSPHILEGWRGRAGLRRPGSWKASAGDLPGTPPGGAGESGLGGAPRGPVPFPEQPPARRRARQPGEGAEQARLQ